MTSSVSGRRRRRLVQVEERHVTGVAGNTIVLRCDLPTSNPPSVRWIDFVYNTSPEPEVIFAGEQLQRTHPNADKFRVDSEFSLTISSLRIDESPGQYVCESEVNGRKHKLDYQLTVCSKFRTLLACRTRERVPNGYTTLLPPPKKEVMFSLRSVCLSVCLFVCPSDNWKSCEQILTKFVGGVAHGSGDQGDKFWWQSGSPSGFRNPKSGFTGLSKKSLVDSDQSCIANLHCKSHSSILLCWRSVEVSALWVLLVVVLHLVVIRFSKY